MLLYSLKDFFFQNFTNKNFQHLSWHNSERDKTKKILINNYLCRMNIRQMPLESSCLEVLLQFIKFAVRVFYNQYKLSCRVGSSRVFLIDDVTSLL